MSDRTMLAVVSYATYRPSSEMTGNCAGCRVPPELTLICSVRPWHRSRARIVGPVLLANATTQPSPEMAAVSPPTRLPASSTLTHSVMPVTRSWTNTSALLFVSFGTRFVAMLSKAT